MLNNRAGHPETSGRIGLIVGGMKSGDLVFGKRPSWLQALCRLLGQPWLHVGIVSVVDDEMGVVELGPAGCGFRPVDVFVAAYREVEVGRFDTCRCCSPALADWARCSIDGPYRYGNLHLIASGVASLVRLLMPTRPAAVDLVCRVMARIPGIGLDGTTLTCATFVLTGLAKMNCRPEIGGVPGRTDGEAIIDERRLLTVTPTDLWSSPQLRLLKISAVPHDSGSSKDIRPGWSAIASAWRRMKSAPGSPARS